MSLFGIMRCVHVCMRKKERLSSHDYLNGLLGYPERDGEKCLSDSTLKTLFYSGSSCHSSVSCSTKFQLLFV